MQSSWLFRNFQKSSGEVFSSSVSCASFLIIGYQLQNSFWKKALTEDFRGFFLKGICSFAGNRFFLSFLSPLKIINFFRFRSPADQHRVFSCVIDFFYDLLPFEGRNISGKCENRKERKEKWKEKKQWQWRCFVTV